MLFYEFIVLEAGCLYPRIKGGRKRAYYIKKDQGSAA
jgi:hypothetical protein